MDSMPIAPHDLGLKNTQQRFGYTLLASGGVVAALGAVCLLRAAGAESSVHEVAVAAVVTLLAFRRVYVGANLVLAVMVDTVGPAGIGGDHTVLRELLLHRRIWTYQRPRGLIRSLFYRFQPRIVYLTPPYRSLLDGLTPNLLVLAVTLAATVAAGAPAVPLLVVASTALFCRWIALHRAIRGLPSQSPPVETHEAPEHLTGAGNPADLYHHVRIAFEQLREKQFQNRMLMDRRPVLGNQAATNQCDADLMVETQPVPEADSGRQPAAALWLDACGAILEVAGYATLLFVAQWAETAERQGWLAGAALLAVAYGSRFLLIAQRIHYTFRFRSDVIWLNFTGSYVLNRVAIGGGLTGLPSTEGQVVKSDLHVFVRGSRLLTECSPPSGTFRDQLFGTTRPAEQTLQSAPRYLVSAAMDEMFKSRLNWIVANVLHYADVGTQLRTPDLMSPDAQQLLSANAQLNRVMHATAQHGAVQGQQAAAALPAPANLPPAPALPFIPASPANFTAGPTAPPAVAPGAPPAAPCPTPAGPRKVAWTCGKCGKSMSAPADWAGKPMKCSACGKQHIVPRG
jgi:hypothetical protein